MKPSAAAAGCYHDRVKTTSDPGAAGLPADAAARHSQPHDARGFRRAVLLLFAGLLSIGMGQSLMFAILPPVARNLGLTEVQVGSIFAVSALLWVLASPFWGRLSDIWGRRPLILVGLIGYTVSMASFGLCVQAGLSGWIALLPAYVLMIVTRAIFGLFGAATVPAAQAYVADRTQPHERATYIAMQGAAFGLGITLGPGFVSLLLVFGLIAPFYAIAALGLVGVLAVLLGVPEQAPRQRQPRSGKVMSPLDARVRPFILVGIALGIGQATAMQTAGFYAIDVLGMSIEQSARSVGLALMGTAGAALFMQLVVIRQLKPTPATMMRVGSVFGMAGFVLLMLGESFAVMFVAMMLLGFGFGLARPGTIAGASLAVGSHEQGAVAGLMNTTGALGTVFAPVVGMWLYQWLPRAPYVLDLVLLAAGLALLHRHPQTRRLRR